MRLQRRVLELYQHLPLTASRWYSLCQAEHAAGLLATGRVPLSRQLGAWAPSAQHALRPARTTRPTMPHGPAPLPRRPRRAALRPQPTACSLVGCTGRAPCEGASAESPEARDLSLRYSRAAAAPSPRSTTMALTPSFGEGLPVSRSGVWDRQFRLEWGTVRAQISLRSASPGLSGPQAGGTPLGRLRMRWRVFFFSGRGSPGMSSGRPDHYILVTFRFPFC